METYPAEPERSGVDMEEHGPSTKSFTTYPIDNIDMVDSSVRILDGNGKLSAVGRVEMKENGEWGTLCAADFEDSAAKLICVKLGYIDGKVLNPEGSAGEDFCSSYKGEDF